MAANAGTLETIARHIGQALQPLQDLFAQDNVTQLFSELGLQFPPQLLQPAFVNALNSGVTAAGGLPNLITQLSNSIDAGDDAAILQAGEQLIQQIVTTINSFAEVGTELGNLAGALPGMNPAEVTSFAQSLSSKLLGYLLISYLEDVQPAVIGAGNLLGFLDYVPKAGVPNDPTHPPFTLRQLQLSKFSDVLTKPGDALKTLYGWGDGGFDGVELISRLNTSLDLLGIPSELKSPTSLQTWLFNLQASPPGLTATLKDQFFSNFDLTLPLSSVWSLQIHMQGDFAVGLGATISPLANVSLKPPSGTLNGQLATDIVAKGPDANHPFIVFGQTGGSRIQADSFTFGVGLAVTWDSGSGSAAAEPVIHMEVKGGKVVIDMSNADGFLATVLSGVHVEAGFDFKVTWRPDSGVHIEGAAQLELALPLHLNLGPVTLPTLYLVGGVSGAGLPLEISAALGVTLGPFAASVDRVGVKGLLTFPDHDGNLGPANLALSFKPPNGLGIAVDAGVVVGGGYIFFDPDKGQYAGILQLALAGIVQVKVIGLLDTILPDGSQGFSFLLIITTDFPPIQLSFGFTLNGVGGIGGVNRTMSVDSLHTGFRAHTLDSILFPPDPIANAPQIISNLRSFFPPAEGRYLFGPMLEIGWGTPTLITLSLGVILELPDPVRIVILGLIAAGLPTKDVALVELHIDVLGIIDFGAKTLSIDGSMYDSRLLIFSMSGDMALRLGWGDNPNFVLSMGGFNPHFNTAGLNVPEMHRLSVSIGNGDNPRISCNSYLAFTSNSVQFGANTEAYASAAGFTIRGWIGFDVLFIISPFSFEFDFSAGFDVSFEGVDLAGISVNGIFSGPRPFHLHGDATLHILWWDVSATLDLTWGDSTPAVLPKVPVLPPLLAALNDARNWSTALPDGAVVAVTLATRKPDDKTLVVHAMGTLGVRETVVPLDIPIAKFGNATPADGNKFSISAVQINGNPEIQQPLPDYFAIGQFSNLSDADKLSLPSYQPFHAGVQIGSSDVVAGQDSPRTVVYEERYIDVPGGLSRFSRRYAMPAAIHGALSQLGAGYLSLVKTTGMSKYVAPGTVSPISVVDPQYVVASTEDLSIRSEIFRASGSSHYEAQVALQAHLATHPEDAGTLQVIPLHEAAA